METRRGLLTKLGIFSAGAICLAIYGRRRAEAYRDVRHRKESDALTDSSRDKFDDDYYYPGKPENLDSQYKRESRYVGAGASYSSRKPGDRLTMFKIFDRD